MLATLERRLKAGSASPSFHLPVVSAQSKVFAYDTMTEGVSQPDRRASLAPDRRSSRERTGAIMSHDEYVFVCSGRNRA